MLELGVLNPYRVLLREAEVLGFDGIDVISGDDLPRALLALRPDLAPTYEGRKEPATDFRGWPINLDPRLEPFVARVATEPIAVIEGSPLHGASVRTILHSSNAIAGIGAAEYLHQPLLLLAIPAGMILIAAEAAVLGFREALYRRIVQRYTGTDPGHGPEAASAESQP